MEWFKKFYTKDFINVVGFASNEQTQLETRFILSVLKLAPGSKILDLCCGYGRHTHLIAQSGDYEVTGMDLSEDYLDIAKKTFSTPGVKFIKGDMRDISFKNYFDAVINMFTSFGFFESDEENENVIKQVNKSLKKRGLFLLDYENKFYFVFNDVFKKGKYWEKLDDNNYILYENTYDVMNEREIFNVHFIENGRVKMSGGYNIKLYSFPEISAMLKRNGFEVLGVWGDYQANVYSVRSKRLITLSRKI
ncbi:MAG: methyltransferase domain-containing protein [Candidatus Aminicenantes bacterium]|nr:methyltransferase domain-containing protein [Candidatus Aminicenantes bacterium]NIM83150.1 methyltransferase domain-containing protein [Candidatus Aminicenantes bacterium]NIN22526.1 methyltransferase domain-containing protein [Candidatus Aminicenantes bacterium]NIN46297.1 methyltransferase domain-containing protein [Candidatus Aminicenantes bacterium]NIN89136.1 methyltransferase domain-containing protein [Candidatus Aminicenantes bacterium]